MHLTPFKTLSLNVYQGIGLNSIFPLCALCQTARRMSLHGNRAKPKVEAALCERYLGGSIFASQL